MPWALLPHLHALHLGRQARHLRVRLLLHALRLHLPAPRLLHLLHELRLLRLLELLPRLADAGWSIYGFTLNQRCTIEDTGVTWVTPADFQETTFANGIEIPIVISLMPIWALPDYQQVLDRIQANT